MYTVFLDGFEWATNLTLTQAKAMVLSYDGEKSCWYEEEDDEENDDLN